MRKGWRIIWPDGTEWDGDCPTWARKPLTIPGARLVPIRIMGRYGRWDCPGCEAGKHH